MSVLCRKVFARSIILVDRLHVSRVMEPMKQVVCMDSCHNFRLFKTCSMIWQSEMDKAKEAGKNSSAGVTIFSKIIDKTIPAKIVYEDDQCLAFHDVAPQAPVHVLVIPKKPIPQISKATNEDVPLLGHLLNVVRLVSEKLDLDDGYRVVINNGGVSGVEATHIIYVSFVSTWTLLRNILPSHMSLPTGASQHVARTTTAVRPGNMSHAEVRIREMENDDVDGTREMIKDGLREHVVTNMNVQMMNVNTWGICFGCSILLSITTSSSVLITTFLNACIFYIAGLLVLNFSLLPREVANVGNGYSKTYRKFWVAEVLSNGTWSIVGSLALMNCDESKDVLEVKRMAVRKGCRRRGISELLMNQAISYCSENGIKELFLQIAPVQKAAYKLYTKHGFERTSTSRIILLYGLLNFELHELTLQVLH